VGTVAAAAEFRGIIHCVLARVTVVRASKTGAAALAYSLRIPRKAPKQGVRRLGVRSAGSLSRTSRCATSCKRRLPLGFRSPEVRRLHDSPRPQVDHMVEGFGDTPHGLKSDGFSRLPASDRNPCLASVLGHPKGRTHNLLKWLPTAVGHGGDPPHRDTMLFRLNAPSRLKLWGRTEVPPVCGGLGHWLTSRLPTG
jgi:hypothetical protein